MTTRMTDTERHEQWLIDLENRVKALELAQEPSLASQHHPPVIRRLPGPPPLLKPLVRGAR